MKTKILVTGTCGVILLATLGCGKQESSPTVPSTPASPSATSAGKTATNTVQAAEKLAADAQKAASTSATEASKLAESTIANVKKLVSEKKYQEALTALQQAATSLQLTPEQKKTVDDLTAQVQKLLATDPAKAAEGLLPKPN